MQVSHVSPNLIAVDLPATLRADPRIILENGTEGWFFRNGPRRTNEAGENIARNFYLSVPPSELTNEDITALNRHCDVREGARNREVKKAISQSLSRYFTDHAYHVTEFGSGAVPIADYLPRNDDVSFHAVDCDPAIVENLQKAGMPASNWTTVMAEGVPADRTAVAVSVYAMHFMVNDEFVDHIRGLTSQDGFFVGNFYIDQKEQATGEQRQKLGEILKKQNMSHVVLKNCASNEYWVIGPNANQERVEAFAAVMEAGEKRGKGPNKKEIVM
jgi:hypothetical protein